MTKRAVDSELHRHIVNVMVSEYETCTPPGEIEGISPRMLACAWGLYAQIHRHARAAMLLTDSGMGHETHLLVRAALEHEILLHWVIERGEPGVDALISTQSKNINRSIDLAREAKMILPIEVEREMLAVSSGRIDEGKAVGQFKRLCEQLDVLELYFVYGVESQFVHPSLLTINSYCDNRGNLTTEPQRDIHRGNLAMLAHCLIWASRDLDSLTPGHPKRVELERLAQSIEAKPSLPAYRTIPPGARKPARKRGR